MELSKTRERCYLCGKPLQSYRLRAGERPPSDLRTRDHVPPEGLFLPPKPSDLFVVPCCFGCNNQHSGFDERLRIVATMPFDRNQTGQRILEDKVLGGTLAKGRQMLFMQKLLAGMKDTAEHRDLLRVRMEAREFHSGMIRITKGLLFCLYPGFNYEKAHFEVIDIRPKPFHEHLRLMTMLKQAAYFERGQRAFQCWRHVEEARGAGAWMLIFYECFGFFVWHTNDEAALGSAKA
jgi:hypothetical protein